MHPIAAIPFIPGEVQGPVSHDPYASGAIVVLDSPSLPPEARPAGVVVTAGAPFSHAMLALLARGIPAVIADADAAAALVDGDFVRLDGARGSVRIVPPDEPLVPVAWPLPKAGQPVRTADGVAVSLRASVRNADGAARARARGAEAIGLVRTEFIEPPDGRLPDAGFYRREFGALLEAAAPLAVTLRLLDIAADKHPDWLPARAGFGGPLGHQGVRLFGDEPVRTVVEAQLTALAGLDAQQRLRLLLPYVTDVAEARSWRAWARARLEVPVGVMIETPAAALEIDALLDAADFAALGTNDLMQCLFAADRDQPSLRRYLDPYAPLLYRFLADIARAAGERLPQVQICGLLSQLPGVLPVLLGLGYRAFSVDAVFIPWLASKVRETRIDGARALAESLCGAADSATVREMLGAVWFKDDADQQFGRSR